MGKTEKLVPKLRLKEEGNEPVTDFHGLTMKTTQNKLVPKLRFPGFEREWEEKTFNEIVIDFRLGGNYQNTENPTCYPLIKMGNIGRGSIILNKIEFIPEDVPVDENDLAKYGDLYFNTRNTLELVGKVSIWLNELPVAYYNSNLMRLRFDNNFYMNYWFNSKEGIKRLRRFATGTTSVAAIYSRDLLTLKISLPALPEQEKIAGFLSFVDTKLQQLREKKDLLAQYKKGLMQQLFSGALRFKDDQGKDFPDWEEKPGNEVFESISDRNHNSDLPILAITQEHGAIPRNLIDYEVSVSDKSVESYKVVNVGDFIISLRSFQGGIEYSTYKGICSPAYIVLRPIIDIDDRFYKSYLKTDHYIACLQRNLEGIRDGKMISYKYFSAISLPYPSLPEQQKIATFLSALDQKIETLATTIAGLTEWKKGLLQGLFV